MKNLLLIAMMPALALLADDRAKQPVSESHTDRFSVAASGAVRLENSFGEVDIDGWDRPEVEVTTVRATQHLYSTRELAGAKRRVDSVQITTKQMGNDVVISTAYPPRSGLTHTLSRRSDVDISYKIHAPRASTLFINDNRGGVNVFDISGAIHTVVINGQITLTLPAKGQYSIDARATTGDVYSDFDGHTQRRQLIGQDFESPAAPPATSLYLRVRLGDIVIQKLNGPPGD